MFARKWLFIILKCGGGLLFVEEIQFITLRSILLFLPALFTLDFSNLLCLDTALQLLAILLALGFF